MSFDLKISFTGMCLFVPDEGRMHVLMPDTGHHHHHADPAGGGDAGGGGPAHGGVHGHSGHDHGAAAVLDAPAADERCDPPAGGDHPQGDAGGGDAKPVDAPTDAGGGVHVEKHVVRAFFDTAHLRKGAEQRDGEFNDGVDVERAIIDLTGIKAAGFSASLEGRNLQDLEPLVGQRLPRALLGGLPENVVGRVTLDRGRATDHAPGAFWSVEGSDPKELTYRIEWTIRDVEMKDEAGDDAFVWKAVAADGSERALPNLHPVPVPISIREEDRDELRPTVAVHLYHTPESELPGVPKKTALPPDGTHFGAFYVFFPKASGRPLPVFRAPAKPGPGGPLGADPERCLGSTVKPG